MTETPILDESAVSEIEARKPVESERELSLPAPFVGLTVAERDALCATVKHQNNEVHAVLEALGQHAVRVREEGGLEDIYSSLAVSVAKLQSQLEQLQKQSDGYKRLLASAEEQNETLLDQLSQLEQLRAENNDLRKDNENLSGVIFNNQHAQFAISRAIQLCKDKAEEWQALFDSDYFGDHDDKIYYVAATNILITELEMKE